MKRARSKERMSIFLSTAFIAAGLLTVIHVKVDSPMLLIGRFFSGYAWVQILTMSILGGFLAVKMTNINRIRFWRTLSWSLFSTIFFAQLVLGICGYEEFLMSGKLHLPIPAVIIGGAIYRLEFGFMPILFISTVLITGPAWCSQLCYFGAMDNLSSEIKKKARKFNTRHLKPLKTTTLLIFVLLVLALRIFEVSLQTAAIIAGVFGITGLLIVILLSSLSGKMLHCIYWCPLGTILNYASKINPFRMYIDENCTECMSCIKTCKYMALEKKNIEQHKPGFTCTLCGDCLSSCPTGSIKYKLWKFSSKNAHRVYVIITVSIYIVFLNVARI